ncbi:hypothetical protein MetexDRAFT_4629 [Methylorubrum extorquens DSM 13060]|uniref:Uncharacterized protein n=1 Tax=Methylorubrum extorquens DSM 13060 TaxID=882800 RepID=H1KPQ3_METEX|nr:hypothetical protein MetexDRAFT_4629 [Methylorubrum extorquens DSM 13060]
MRIKDGQIGAALIQFMDDVENVARITAKPISADHDQFVTLADEVEDRSEFRAAIPRGTGHLL